MSRIHIEERDKLRAEVSHLQKRIRDLEAQNKELRDKIEEMDDDAFHDMVERDLNT